MKDFTIDWIIPFLLGAVNGLILTALIGQEHIISQIIVVIVSSVFIAELYRPIAKFLRG